MKDSFLKSIGLLLFVFCLSGFASPIEGNAQNRKAEQKKERKAKKANSRTAAPARKAAKPARTAAPVRVLPRRGGRVNTVPARAAVIRHGRYDYRFYDGIFYRPNGGVYIVAAPPVGIRVNVLPPNPYRFNLRNRAYFYYYGTFYSPVDNGEYEVIDAPVGARVDSLPEGYEVFELDGQIYYKMDETYYKPITDYDGTTIYEVVKV